MTLVTDLLCIYLWLSVWFGVVKIHKLYVTRLMCQLGFFGYSQQKLALANISKMEWFGRILKVPKINEKVNNQAWKQARTSIWKVHENTSWGTLEGREIPWREGQVAEVNIPKETRLYGRIQSPQMCRLLKKLHFTIQTEEGLLNYETVTYILSPLPSVEQSVLADPRKSYIVLRGTEKATKTP